jgi:PQQ-dependent dehydrogenase (methanol/ethanol family)
MSRRGKFAISAFAVIAMAWLGLALSGWSPLTLLGTALNTVRSARNPAGTLSVETNSAAARADEPDARSAAQESPVDSGGDGWPSYNRTLTSERYSRLRAVDTHNAHELKVLCSYDTGLRESFETGPLVVEGALIGTTGFDVFSIDPANCRENWRTHENYAIRTVGLNRGAAYLDGRLFRGTMDGRILAYDFRTGTRLWATSVADPGKGEMVDAAPIAWNGLVFAGTATGFKGMKGRMYALSASTGAIVWETYLVPRSQEDPTRAPPGAMPTSAITTWKNAPDVPVSGGGTWTSYTLDPATGRLYVPVANPSPDFVLSLREGENLYTDSVVALDAGTGAYLSHFQVAPRDWHDWDVSNTPAIIVTRSGRRLLSFAPKNGYLYGVDLATNGLLYRSAVTRVENVDAPLSAGSNTHFCPGAAGGGEWNGVAYDPQTNLIFTGEAEWCTTVRLQSDSEVKAVPNGSMWMGSVKIDPLDLAGKQDPHADWAGWLYATDADSGAWQWRAKTNYPVLSGITATGGGLVLFGDMGGNFYVLDAASGKKLWNKKLGGAIGGGVITYEAAGSQKIAVAAGLTSILWPTEQATAKIVILGLGR